MEVMLAEPRRSSPITSSSRTVVIVAPQFPPSNLTAGHRTRLFVRHLPEFGYTPIVLTVEAGCYEERLDVELEDLVAPSVQIVRTKALPTRPVRLVGDLGIRSFAHHLAALRRLHRQRRIDLLYIPIPPNYSSLLGPLAKALFGIPYAIDYIDPWVYPITDDERRSWKARVSHVLARLLEPIAVSSAAGITGVAEGYYAGVLARHPHLRRRPSAGIPYGGEPLDHQHVALTSGTGRPPRLLDRPELHGQLVLLYAGALLPRAHGTLRALLGAARRWRESGDPEALRFRLLFVGTGARPTDPSSGLVLPLARECGAESFVVEVADRQPYLDVLAALHHAQGVMVLGSDEASYTASKTFQALHSRRPVLAVLHEGSSASAILRQMTGVQLVTFTDHEPVHTRGAALEASLRAVLGADPHRSVDRDLEVLEQYSARAMSRKLATFFDAVLAGRSVRGAKA